MHRFLFGIAVLVILYCLADDANGAELIREFTGSGSQTTAEFEVRAPWIVDWRTRGDYPGQMAVEVNLLNPSGEFVGKIAMTKYVDDGVRLMDEGGRYVLQVNASLAEWTLRVEQLTREEAKTYTPKEKIE
jgi:hypothetical protein